MKIHCLVLCMLALLGSAFSFKSYEGYQVLQTIPLDKVSFGKINLLYQQPEFFFWSEPRVGHKVEIMAAPQHLQTLKEALNLLGLQPAVFISNVGEVFNKERAELLRVAEKKSGRAPSFDRYYTYDETMAYLNEVVEMYPNIASIVEIGTSYEGRSIRGLKLSNGPGKSAFLIDSLMHAYEWMSGPVVLYAINQLTENLAANQALLDNNDFYFIPVVNPDGYSFSWTDDRLWRKTRSLNEGSDCLGSDLNRNFDQHWAEGGGLDPCEEQYHGTVPFSEIESQALSNFILNETSITMYLTVHSHGQYILHPWGHTTDLPPTIDDLNRVGNEARSALFDVTGTIYEVGSAANILYFKYGSSYDWTYEQVGIEMSFTLYLPSGGAAGFDPPPSDILPVVTETWEAIKAFAANVPASRARLH